MELYVRFDRRGHIVSVSKVETMHESLDHPHGGLEEGESVLRVKPTPEQAKLAAHELAALYTVDVKKGKLHKIRPPRGGE